LAVHDGDLVRPHGQLGRRRVHFTRAEVELGSVKGPPHLAAFHPTVGKRRILVGAGVVQSEQFPVLRMEYGDRWGRIEADGVSGGQRAEWAGDVHL
jgi:hypothetical protein